MKKILIGMVAAALLSAGVVASGVSTSDCECPGRIQKIQTKQGAYKPQQSAHKAQQAKSAHKKHWDYGVYGPAHWGEFSETCKTGKAQSPINIVSSSKVSLGEKLHLDESRSTAAKVYDNGHGIKVEPAQGGKMAVDGVEYKLLQFHFHGRSENTIDGHQFALEAHMVHQNKDGGYAVVGIMFEEGKNNPLLDNILGNVGENIRLDPNDLLPENTHSYYYWKGSFTTPPCTEGVEWFLMKEVVSASKEQIAAFRKYYDNNFRPTLPLNGRKVWSY